MAAGLGFKTFTTGEVLTAADTNGYLMQGVLVFASAAARDASITSPQEGQFAYLKDTNVTTYYTGSAWTNLDTTGMTNPMTTTGDMVYSSSGSTPARLGIGTTGQVVTVAGGIPSWATPSGGTSKIGQVVSTSYSTNTTSTSAATYIDTGLTLSITPTLNTSKILVIITQPIQTSATGTRTDIYYKVLRGATEIGGITTAGQTAMTLIGATGGLYINQALATFTNMVSPATTSSTTYKTQFHAGSGTSPSAQVNVDGQTSTITLMEVLA